MHIYIDVYIYKQDRCKINAQWTYNLKKRSWFAIKYNKLCNKNEKY